MTAPAMGSDDEYPSPTIADSRRLTGANWYSRWPGAVLDVRVETDAARRAVDRWPFEARTLAEALGWHDGEYVARHGRHDATCFLTAPLDGLMTATSVAEQAWVRAEAAVADDENGTTSPTPSPDALRTQWEEERGRLAAAARLLTTARLHRLDARFDDEQLAVGSGAGGRVWRLDDVPPVEQVPWNDCRNVPTVLVTGSNGKTTTTRLVARMLRQAGHRTGWSSSDGVYVGGEDGPVEALARGDYTGPAGARLALADTRVQAAVLETARGGILRRGLAVSRADVAVITNISLDHLGEYGVYSLDDLAAVKGVVASVVHDTGRVVLNADDAALVALAPRLSVPTVWFSADGDNPRVHAGVHAHGDGAELRDGHLWLCHARQWTDVGAVARWPLTLSGAARFNIANAQAAALAAVCAGVPVSAVRAVLEHFGRRAEDNPGRLQRWDVGGITALVDYAHNPDGLRALAEVATQLPARRRLLVLGQAGDRDDAQLVALAQSAYEALRPDRVIIKEMPTDLRGRAAGDVPAVLRGALIAAGVAETQVSVSPTELDAVRDALAWARPGDLLVLPTHVEKTAVAALLTQLAADGWTAGTPF